MDAIQQLQQVQQYQQSPTSALNLTWTFGFNRDTNTCIHNLSDARQKVLVYASGHTCVLYDWSTSRQKLLQGHCNMITSMTVSRDRRYLATVDKGPNSMVIVWDLKPGLPKHDITISSSTNPISTNTGNSINSITVKDGMTGKDSGVNTGTGGVGGGLPNGVYENDGTLNAVPIKLIHAPHNGYGVLDIEFTPCMRYLVTLGGDYRVLDDSETETGGGWGGQTVCVWSWTTVSQDPIATYVIGMDPVTVTGDGDPNTMDTMINVDEQTGLKVNPCDTFEFMTTGMRSIRFYVWGLDGISKASVTCFVPVVDGEGNHGHGSGGGGHTKIEYTVSTFYNGSTTVSNSGGGGDIGGAVTGTTDGDLIVWTECTLTSLTTPVPRGHKSPIKHIRIHASPITCLATVNGLLVTGGADGFIKVFDGKLRIVFWYERVGGGPVCGVAMSGLGDWLFEDVGIPEMIVATRWGRVVVLGKSTGGKVGDGKEGSVTYTIPQTPVYPPTSASTRRDNHDPASNNPLTVNPTINNNNSDITGIPSQTPLITSIHNTINAIACHPELPRFVVGGDAGVVGVWDYMTKNVVTSRLFEEPVTNPVSNTLSNGVGKLGDDTMIQSSQGKKHVMQPMKIMCVAYTRSGKTIALGFSSGVIRIIDSTTLRDLPQTYMMKGGGYGYEVSRYGIVRIGFSRCGEFCVACDGDGVVCVMRKDVVKVGDGTVSGGGRGGSAGVSSDRGTGERVGSAGRKSDGSTTDNEGGPVPKHRVEWVFIGRRKTHYRDIIALLFPNPITSTGTIKGTTGSNGDTKDGDKDVKMISVSRDKHIVTYNLTKSSLVTGIQVESIQKIEQIYRPDAAVLYETNSGKVHDEQSIVTVNSGFKIRVVSVGSGVCRKVVRAPVYGGRINQLVMIPNGGGNTGGGVTSEPKYMAFTTTNQVVGVIKLPLDGNPYKTSGIIGHVGEVSCMTCTYTGSHIITVGKHDGIINMWTLNTGVIEAQVSIGGGEMSLQPYLQMLDPEETGGGGGNGTGKVYREFEDYFYYAQLKSQGEDVTGHRVITDTVSLDQVPCIMQAMGYYPSNQEMDDMMNEVKYTRFMNGEGEEVDTITLGDLIRLYVNHRPVRELTMDDLEVVLSHAKRLEPGRPMPSGPVSKLMGHHRVGSHGIVSLLQQYGESMSVDDAREAFKMLLQDKSKYEGKLPDKMTVREFIEDVLGFGGEEGSNAANAAEGGTSLA